jgi:hypothetical protein
MSAQTHNPTVQVERLRLKLTGLDEHAARQFARLVAENLVPGLTAAAAGGVDLFGGDLKVDVTQQPAATAGHGGPRAAQQVAAEVLAALFDQAAPAAGEL